jgi:hypothetical protein
MGGVVRGFLAPLILFLKTDNRQLVFQGQLYLTWTDEDTRRDVRPKMIITVDKVLHTLSELIKSTFVNK